MQCSLQGFYNGGGGSTLAIVVGELCVGGPGGNLVGIWLPGTSKGEEVREREIL